MKKNTGTYVPMPWCKKTIIIMKSIFIFITLFSFNLVASTGYSQNLRLNISANNITLEQLFNHIEKESEFSIIYKSKEVNLKEKVTVNEHQQTVDIILNKVLARQGLKYSINDKHIIIYKPKQAEFSTISMDQQQPVKKKISGVIKDKKGEPIIGVSVAEKGTTNGTFTDADGTFTLNISEGATLTVSYIGYNPQEIVVGTRTYFEIVMLENVKILDEVVVTALGIKKSEKALGYSAQNISGDEFTNVKAVDAATSLSGKIAGLTILNSPNFNSEPTILLRGESPLIVIDGIPFENTRLKDISSDDIETLTVLKGATASALYGSKGASGAIMITTKRGSEEGLHINASSNTMFNAGYLSLPEAQSSYSTGSGGKYRKGDEFVWGDKMDIGRTAEQYDPYTYEWREMPLVSKGKDNFKNFMQQAFVTNNNINVTYKAKNGSFRSSLTHIYNKGQFPRNKMNRFNFSVAGDMKIGKFSMDASINYNMKYSPQTRGTGYGYSSYIYNMIVWTGTDFDVRDFKNYWIEGKENIEQNWHYPEDYNNPYFLANEAINSEHIDRTNAQFTVNYEISDWLKSTLRVGSDFYTSRVEVKEAMSTRGEFDGYYRVTNNRGYSGTGDFLLLADKKVGDFNVGGLLGAGITFYEDDTQSANTRNGITIPGFYSLKASVGTPASSSTVNKKQTNSVYGKAEISWKNSVYLEVTGRNDWVSTLSKEERSYFYPSVSGSVILSELLPLPEWLSFWKVRSSWAMTKAPASVYKINKTYSITLDAWDGMSTATYPTIIRDATILPEKSISFEVGTGIHFLQNRLRFDFAYYTKLFSDLQREAPISRASGFNSSLINIDEERIKKGIEITIGGDIFKTKNFDWTSTFNWSRDRLYYHKVDPVYSTDKPWVKKGMRVDALVMNDWERDTEGNIIHVGGMPKLSDYDSKIGHARADWLWGFTNHFRYKDFTLGLSVDGRVGGKAFNRTEQALWNAGTHKKSDNQWRYDQVVNGLTNYIGPGVKIVSGSVKYDSYGNIIENSDTRVFAPNDVEVTYEGYTKVYHPWNNSKRTQNVQDLTYFKLRELSIGYLVPKSICEKMKLKKAHVALVGQNLLMWSKEFKYSDPDGVYEDKAETLNSPSIRYIGFNIKLDF